MSPVESTLYLAAVIIATALLIISSIVYGIQAYKGTINPVPTTWILMTVFLGLSLLMYWHDPIKSLTGNISLTAGFTGIVLILPGILFGRLKRRELYASFDSFQISCLILSGVVVVIWKLTESHFWSYVLIQAVALIAYSATVRKLWNARGSSEPLYIWVSVLAAVIVAIYPSIMETDKCAWVYMIRAVPSTAGVIWLIKRANEKKVTCARA